MAAGATGYVPDSQPRRTSARERTKAGRPSPQREAMTIALSAILMTCSRAEGKVSSAEQHQKHEHECHRRSQLTAVRGQRSATFHSLHKNRKSKFEDFEK